MNAVTYKEVFPLIKDNRIWLGNGFSNGNAYFKLAGSPDKDFANGVFDETTGLVKFRNCCWFTNLEHGRRHQPISLMTKAENLKFSKHKEIKGREDYQHYDNCNAIEVPFTDAIPSDYNGIMGVPISFLDKYCPEQFVIAGITKTWYGFADKVYPEQIQVSKDGKRSKVSKLNDGATILLTDAPEAETYYIVGEEMYTQVYARVLIRKKQQQ